MLKNYTEPLFGYCIKYYFNFPALVQYENVSFLDQIARDKITERDKLKQKEKKKHRLISEIKKENGEMKLFQKGKFAWTHNKKL